MPADWPYPFWFAHRGAGKEAPENTLVAFRTGMAAGFRAFECDMQLSLDGEPFLLHDSSLERTTNGEGLASALPWSALAALDAGAWFGAPFTGEPLCSLAALATLAAQRGLALNLELKPSAGEAERVGAGVARWLAAHWRGVPPLLSSFEAAALAAARDTGAGWPLALLLAQWRADAAALAHKLGAVAVVGHHTALNAGRIAALHARGLRVLAYTVNNATRAHALMDWGIDGLITDRMDFPAACAPQGMQRF